MLRGAEHALLRRGACTGTLPKWARGPQRVRHWRIGLLLVRSRPTLGLSDPLATSDPRRGFATVATRISHGGALTLTAKAAGRAAHRTPYISAYQGEREGRLRELQPSGRKVAG